MIEPVSRTKDQKLFRVVLRAVVGDQPFRNSMLVEDSFGSDIKLNSLPSRGEGGRRGREGEREGGEGREGR